MITDAIIDFVVALLGAMFSLLPEDSFGFWDDGPGGEQGSVVGLLFGLGSYSRSWAWLAPIEFMADTLGTVLYVVFPVTVAYLLANWVYKHIPTIGGFGPGSG